MKHFNEKCDTFKLKTFSIYHVKNHIKRIESKSFSIKETIQNLENLQNVYLVQAWIQKIFTVLSKSYIRQYDKLNYSLYKKLKHNTYNEKVSAVLLNTE